jgi:hypothetical protein
MLAPELQALVSEVQRINEQTTALCAGLNEGQLAWRPQPGRWSIAENLIHLRTVAEVFLPSLDQAIADARTRNLLNDGPFRVPPAMSSLCRRSTSAA